MADTRIRFETAADVFGAFETVAADVGEPPTDETPLAFLARIARKDPPFGALFFLSYALPKREAVWWACRAVRNLTDLGDSGTDEPLVAAEAWVRDPTDEKRRAALSTAFSTSSVEPGLWCALAAGWSSGNFLGDDDKVAAVKPFLTARNAAIAATMAAGRVPPDQLAGRLRLCLDSGAAFARGEPLKL